jgi:hypothetical protein
MAEQLVLLDETRQVGRIDERTREIGRRGVAEARRVLLEVIQASAAARAAQAASQAGEVRSHQPAA